jgi:hypothetical protein
MHMDKAGGFRVSIFILYVLQVEAVVIMLATLAPASAQQGDPCPHGALAQHDKINPLDVVISEVCHGKAGGQFFTATSTSSRAAISCSTIRPTRRRATSGLDENGGLAGQSISRRVPLSEAADGLESGI